MNLEKKISVEVIFIFSDNNIENCHHDDCLQVGWRDKMGVTGNRSSTHPSQSVPG